MYQKPLGKLYLEIALLLIFVTTTAFSYAVCCNPTTMTICFTILEDEGNGQCEDCVSDCQTTTKQGLNWYTWHPYGNPRPNPVQLSMQFPVSPYHGYQWCKTGAPRAPTTIQVQYMKRCCDGSNLCLMISHLTWYTPPPCKNWDSQLRTTIQMYCARQYPGTCKN